MANNPTYWRDYSLKEDPFAAAIDVGQLFQVPQWEQHLDLLQHLATYSHVLLMVVGPQGVGKTALGQLLLKELGDDKPMLRIKARPELSVDEFFMAMCDSYGVPLPDSDLELAYRATRFIDSLQALNHDCLCFIDDAHKLSQENIEFLLSILSQQTGDSRTLHILLFGQSELESRFHEMAEKMPDEIETHVIELEPLTEEETQQYIQHRLETAGLTGSSPLASNHLADIYENALGVPQQINLNTRVVLQSLLNEQNAPKDEKAAKKPAKEKTAKPNTEVGSAPASTADAESNPILQQNEGSQAVAKKDDTDPVEQSPVDGLDDAFDDADDFAALDDPIEDGLDPDLDLNLGDDIDLDDDVLELQSASVDVEDRAELPFVRRHMIPLAIGTGVLLVSLIIFICYLAFSDDEPVPQPVIPKANPPAAVQFPLGPSPTVKKGTPLPPPPRAVKSIFKKTTAAKKKSAMPVKKIVLQEAPAEKPRLSMPKPLEKPMPKKVSKPASLPKKVAQPARLSKRAAPAPIVQKKPPTLKHVSIPPNPDPKSHRRVSLHAVAATVDDGPCD